MFRILNARSNPYFTTSSSVSFNPVFSYHRYFSAYASFNLSSDIKYYLHYTTESLPHASPSDITNKDTNPSSVGQSYATSNNDIRNIFSVPNLLPSTKYYATLVTKTTEDGILDSEPSNAFIIETSSTTNVDDLINYKKITYVGVKEKNNSAANSTVTMKVFFTTLPEVEEDFHRVDIGEDFILINY